MILADKKLIAANPSQLADIYLWQGRVAAATGKIELARENFHLALAQYKESNFKADCYQVIALNARLAELPAQTTVTDITQSLFSSPLRKPETFESWAQQFSASTPMD